jgi:hypothetical protein
MKLNFVKLEKDTTINYFDIKIFIFVHLSSLIVDISDKKI